LNSVGALTHQEFEVVEDAATRLEGASEFGFTVDEVEWLCDAAFQAERIIEPVSRATAINDYRYGRCQFRRLRPPEQWRTYWRTAGRRAGKGAPLLGSTPVFVTGASVHRSPLASVPGPLICVVTGERMANKRGADVVY